MDLESIDPLEWVRSQTSRFFPSGRVDPTYLLAYLMADVLELGGGSCTIRQMDRWRIIGSDIDWLATSSCSDVELFSRVIPEPKHGEHSMRGEVLVGAFATTACIVLDGHTTPVVGELPPPQVLALSKGLTRAIVFACSVPANPDDEKQPK